MDSTGFNLITIFFAVEKQRYGDLKMMAFDRNNIFKTGTRFLLLALEGRVRIFLARLSKTPITTYQHALTQHLKIHA